MSDEAVSHLKLASDLFNHKYRHKLHRLHFAGAAQRSSINEDETPRGDRVFKRIRENIDIQCRISVGTEVNQSVNQSINHSIFRVA